MHPKKHNKSQAQPKRNETPTSGVEGFLKQFGKRGISALASLAKDEQAQVINWAQDIVDHYGFILKENPMKIKNLVDLPCPKEDLKIAIKILMPAYVAKGSDDIVNLLKDRYVSLGAFQKISQEDKDNLIKEANIIDRKLESTGTAHFPTYHQYMEIVISEQKILLDEVISFIDDMQVQRSGS